MRRRLPIVLAFVAAGGLSLGAAASTGDRWWAYVEKLAGDGMEGRNTGTRGSRN